MDKWKKFLEEFFDFYVSWGYFLGIILRIFILTWAVVIPIVWSIKYL